MSRVAFTVPGKPVPLQRHRTRGGRQYLPARSRDYREVVQSHWLAAGRPSLGDMPLTASMRFYGAHASADLDNLLKGVLDALNGLAFDDDAQVVCFSGVHKLPADERGARAEIELWPAGCGGSS
jgi:crossover junction endodeoxyribonuclease RusA